MLTQSPQTGGIIGLNSASKKQPAEDKLFEQLGDLLFTDRTKSSVALLGNLPGARTQRVKSGAGVSQRFEKIKSRAPIATARN